jgi:hypothetical protein
MTGRVYWRAKKQAQNIQLSRDGDLGVSSSITSFPIVSSSNDGIELLRIIQAATSPVEYHTFIMDTMQWAKQQLIGFKLGTRKKRD